MEPDKLHIFEILAREHEPMLMAYLLSLVADRQLAEDVAQETFLIAYRKIGTLQKTESFGAWLRGIARFEVLSALRKSRREIPTDPLILAGIEDVFHGLEQNHFADTWEERFRAVEDCFLQLPDKLRTTCRLHYYEERKAREIAETMAIGLDAVLKRLERAREALRDCVLKRLSTQGT